MTVLSSLALLTYWQSEDALRDASANLHQCSVLAGQIKSLRSTESIALEQPVSAASVSNEMVRVARLAGISEPQVQEIRHLPSAQIEKTDFRRDDTLLRLTGISIKHVAKLLLHFESLEQSPTPTSLVLKTDNGGVRAQGNEEVWSAELILTRLTFAAQSLPVAPIR
jgi:hypothetical protein